MRWLYRLVPDHPIFDPIIMWVEGRLTGERCRAYGGTMTDGRVRTCDKTRGHFDSHTYEFEEPS